VTLNGYKSLLLFLSVFWAENSIWVVAVFTPFCVLGNIK